MRVKSTPEIRVWDLPTRLFHWLLVLLLGCSWATGELGGTWLKWHFWSGYGILTLLLFRIGWGFVGSSSARFSNFLRSPFAALGHLKHLLERKPDSDFGHNAAGGWMVLVLLLVLLAQTGTGLFADDDVATTGPLASLVSYETAQRLTSIHKWNFNLILALAALHILAVLVYLLYAKRNLVRAMITGRKALPDGMAPPQLAFASAVRAGLVLLIAAGLVYSIVRFGVAG